MAPLSMADMARGSVVHICASARAALSTSCRGGRGMDQQSDPQRSAVRRWAVAGVADRHICASARAEVSTSCWAWRDQPPGVCARMLP